MAFANAQGRDDSSAKKVMKNKLFQSQDDGVSSDQPGGRSSRNNDFDHLDELADLKDDIDMDMMGDQESNLDPDMMEDQRSVSDRMNQIQDKGVNKSILRNEGLSNMFYGNRAEHDGNLLFKDRHKTEDDEAELVN